MSTKVAARVISPPSSGPPVVGSAVAVAVAVADAVAVAVALAEAVDIVV